MEEKTEAVKSEETTVGLTMNYNPFSFISCQEDALVLAGCISHGLDADVIKKSGDLFATARAMLLDACVCLLYRQGGDSMSMQGLVDLLQNDISHNEDQDMPSIKAAYDKIEADGAGANTVKTYRSMLRCYVEPYIGRADVGDVEPYVVDGLYFTLLTEGGRDGQGIAASKVVNLHWFLSGAWRWMASQGIAASNVLDSVTKPRPQPREAAAYDEADFAKLSAALAEELARDEGGRSAVMRRNCAMAAYLALWTGMRCGEVCALARPDVRLAARTALVRATMVETPSGLVRQPKTKGKRSRSVSLYGETAERVRAHLDWQAEYLPKGLDVRRLGVCCDADGGFLRPSAVSAWFSGLRDELGLQRGTSFHTLRHTHATWLLLQGVDPKTVMERLGHAKVTTTLELYGHVLPGRDAAAAQAFAEAASMAGGTP